MTNPIGTWKVSVDEALEWKLHKTTLQHALIDKAEEELEISEVDCIGRVTVVNGFFVVTFTEE